VELLHAGTRGKRSLPRQPVGRVVPLVTETTAREVLSSESRKRVSLPPEGCSSKKTIKLSALQQDGFGGGEVKEEQRKVIVQIRSSGSQVYHIISNFGFRVQVCNLRTRAHFPANFHNKSTLRLVDGAVTGQLRRDSEWWLL